MDAIQLLEVCSVRAQLGQLEEGVSIASLAPAEFDVTWRRDPMKVRDILDEILTSPHPDYGLELLLKCGAIDALFPELRALKDLGDEGGRHKDVWAHTKAVVAGTPAQVELRWSALMHDIGKARTRRVYPNGKVTFHNHDFVGAKMVDSLQARIGLFKGNDALLQTVRSLVLNHLRPAGYKKDWSDSGVRRLLTDLGGMENFHRLMALSRADLTTKNANKRERALSRGRELEERVLSVFSEDNAPKLPKGTMGIIMEKAKTPPGPWLNEIRSRLESSMATGELPAENDVDFYVAEGLRLFNELYANLSKTLP